MRSVRYTDDVCKVVNYVMWVAASLLRAVSPCCVYSVISQPTGQRSRSAPITMPDVFYVYGAGRDERKSDG